jgi:hypothetical protein
MRGTRRFKVKGKLALRYVGPFKIISLKGEVGSTQVTAIAIRCTRCISCVATQEIFVSTRGTTTDGRV